MWVRVYTRRTQTWDVRRIRERAERGPGREPCGPGHDALGGTEQEPIRKSLNLGRIFLVSI